MPECVVCVCCIFLVFLRVFNYLFCYLGWAQYPVYPLYMWLWGIWMVCFVACFVILIWLNTPFTHYTCEFRVLGWFVLLSWLGSIPSLHVKTRAKLRCVRNPWLNSKHFIRVFTFIIDIGMLCFLAQYPVYTLYVWVSGIGMVCFVILIGLQEAHFEPFRAQAREQAKTGPRRHIFSLFGPRCELHLSRGHSQMV